MSSGYKSTHNIAVTYFQKTKGRNSSLQSLTFLYWKGAKGENLHLLYEHYLIFPCRHELTRRKGKEFTPIHIPLPCDTRESWAHYAEVASTPTSCLASKIMYNFHMLPLVSLLKFLGEKPSSPALLYLYAVTISEMTEWSGDG